MTREAVGAVVAGIGSIIVIIGTLVSTIVLYKQSRQERDNTNKRFDESKRDNEKAHAAIGKRIEGVEKRFDANNATLIQVAKDVAYIAGRMQGREDARTDGK